MTKSDFLNRSGTPKKITLDDGREVHIRKLSQADVETMHKKYTVDGANAAEGLRFVVCRGLVDETGVRIFEDGELDALKSIDADTIQQLAGEIVEHAGLNRKKQ